MATSYLFAENYLCPLCSNDYKRLQMLYLDEKTKVLRCPTHPNYSRDVDNRAQLVRYEDVDGTLIRPYVPPTQQGGGVGPQGPAGPQGEIGPQGPVGPKGDKGDAGAKGADGATGPKGDKGDTGLTGPQGLKGDTGAKGADGAKGDQGIQGLKGETGAAGKDGAAGAKGDKGDAGKSVTSVKFTTDVDGKITGGTTTFSDASTAAIVIEPTA